MDELTIQQLERLQSLRERGAITADEFAKAKANVLTGGAGSDVPQEASVAAPVSLAPGHEPTSGLGGLASADTAPPSPRAITRPARTGTLTGELRRAPQWVWIVAAVGLVVIGAGIINSIMSATAPYSATQEFGNLKMIVTGPALSGGELVVPLEFQNTAGQDRYDYDVTKSFSVNFVARGKVYPSSVDGVAVGTLAPRETRSVKLHYAVAGGECPNNLHFKAQDSPSSGDIALKEVGC